MSKKVVSSGGKEYIILNFEQAQSKHNGLFIQPLDIPKHELIELIQRTANVLMPSLKRMNTGDLAKLLAALVGK